MTKNQRPPIPINHETLKQALTESDDFGHEMRVRTLLEHSGGKVQHGWTYTDPTLKKTRQFDLRCEMRHGTMRRFFQLALECKNLAAESPLIVSGISRTQEESFHDVIASEYSMNSGQVRPAV